MVRWGSGNSYEPIHSIYALPVIILEGREGGSYLPTTTFVPSFPAYYIYSHSLPLCIPVIPLPCPYPCSSACVPACRCITVSSPPLTPPFLVSWRIPRRRSREGGGRCLFHLLPTYYSGRKAFLLPTIVTTTCTRYSYLTGELPMVIDH